MAAVCYRMGKRGFEFLLVQTRGGRWIFPKGGVERGLTHAQSAALEAFEEAGVHGRMEAIPFARYFRRKGDAAARAKGKGSPAARSAQPELAVAAHLCEVSRLEPPQESNRHPTWFSAERAKQRLLKDRAPELGAELARVVDRAAARIRRLQGDSSHLPGHARLDYTKPGPTKKDALQEVRFEAFELAHVHSAAWSSAYLRYIRSTHTGARSSAGKSAPPEIPVDGQLDKAWHGPIRPILRLASGEVCSRDTRQKVQFIDGAHATGENKAPAKPARNRRE